MMKGLIQCQCLLDEGSPIHAHPKYQISAEEAGWLLCPPFPPYLHQREKSSGISSHLNCEEPLVVCLDGDLVLVFFAFFKQNLTICLNFSLRSLPLKLTLEKLYYKKCNKYLLNW